MALARTDVARISVLLKHMTGKPLSDPAIPALLARWARTSTWASNALGQAAVLAGTVAVRKLVHRSVKEYAAAIGSASQVVGLLLDLNSPKTGIRTLSQYYTGCLESLGTHQYGWDVRVPRPVCADKAFHDAWGRALRPLEIGPIAFSDKPAATGICWPLWSWARYIASRPAFMEPLDVSKPLTLIIRGDGYPVAGVSFCQLSIGLANHGKLARHPAFTWVIALAVCHDSEMETLGELWKEQFQVCVGRVLVCMCAYCGTPMYICYGNGHRTGYRNVLWYT